MALLDATTPTWRYKAGLALFVVGNIIVIVGILAPVLGLASMLGAKTVGAMILGGEALAMTSIAFIGRRGFSP